MKVSNTSQRLKEAMKRQRLKQVDILNKIKPLCEKYNIRLGSNDLSQYVTGKVEPSQKKLTLLAEVLNTNEPYLMGYDVPYNMSDTNHNDLVKLIQNYENFLTEDDIDTIKFIINKRINGGKDDK